MRAYTLDEMDAMRDSLIALEYPVPPVSWLTRHKIETQAENKLRTCFYASVEPDELIKRAYTHRFNQVVAIYRDSHIGQGCRVTMNSDEYYGGLILLGPHGKLITEPGFDKFVQQHKHEICADLGVPEKEDIIWRYPLTRSQIEEGHE